MGYYGDGIGKRSKGITIPIVGGTKGQEWRTRVLWKKGKAVDTKITFFKEKDMESLVWSS